MPELPEVEILVRHLERLLPGRRVRDVQVFRPKISRPTSLEELQLALVGARFEKVTRRGKFLLFHLRASKPRRNFTLLGHLGMTGRMFLLRNHDQIPRHAAVVLGLGTDKFVFEDTRYFGRLTLDCQSVEKLGPEPLDEAFTPQMLRSALVSCRQPVKVKLLDQSALAGVGNIYASEALHLARISPLLPARSLSDVQSERLHRAIRSVLSEAIAGGSTVPLNFSGAGARDGLFYYGSAPGTPSNYEERLRVYDRADEPCLSGCGGTIKRIVQAARSTFYCPRCQGRKR